MFETVAKGWAAKSFFVWAGCSEGRYHFHKGTAGAAHFDCRRGNAVALFSLIPAMFLLKEGRLSGAAVGMQSYNNH